MAQGPGPHTQGSGLKRVESCHEAKQFCSTHSGVSDQGRDGEQPDGCRGFAILNGNGAAAGAGGWVLGAATRTHLPSLGMLPTTREGTVTSYCCS